MKNITFVFLALGLTVYAQKSANLSIAEIRQEKQDAFPRFIRFQEQVKVAPETMPFGLKRYTNCPRNSAFSFRTALRIN
jgi:hypothetical protein